MCCAKPESSSVCCFCCGDLRRAALCIGSDTETEVVDSGALGLHCLVAGFSCRPVLEP